MVNDLLSRINDVHLFGATRTLILLIRHFHAILFYRPFILKIELDFEMT